MAVGKLFERDISFDSNFIFEEVNSPLLLLEQKVSIEINLKPLNSIE